MARQLGQPSRASVTTVGNHFASPAAKAKLMRQIRDDGLPDAFSASTHARKRAAEVTHCLQDVALDLDDGTSLTVPMTKPAVVLQHACRKCANFAALLQTALTEAGSDPLELVLYFDEIEPGDPLKKGDRKMLAVYWTLAQFGDQALSNDDCWFTLAVIRTNPVAEHLMDEYCQIMCKTLDVFFTGIDSFSDGVAIEIFHGITTLLTFIFAHFVSDEKAIKQLTGVKGASGRKLCLFCMNIKAWRFFKPDPLGFHLASNSLAPDDFKLHSDASLKQLYRKVLNAKSTMPHNQFLEYEREQGLSANERYHPLLRDEFQPISTIVFDPQHVYFCGGPFEVEAQAFFDRLEASGSGLGFQAFHEYAQRWTWPGGFASGKNCAKKGHWHGTASEYLSVAPVLEQWVNAVVMPAGVCLLECHSMIELCKTAGLLQRAMHGSGDTDALADALEVQILGHFAAQQSAYGSTLWQSKSHHAMHLHTFLRKHKRLFNCFTPERKHMVPKMFAVHRHNTLAFERGILEELTDQHFWELQKPLVRNTLANEREASQRLHDVMVADLHLLDSTPVATARVARVGGRSVCVGDVVLMTDRTVAEVWFFAAVHDQVYACVSKWPTARVTSSNTLAVRIVDDPVILPLNAVVVSLTYRRESLVQLASVLLPSA